MRVTKFLYRFVALTVVTVLAACGSPPVPSASQPTNTPRPSATPERPTQQASAADKAYIPMIQGTQPTPEPTSTPAPTATPQPTPTPAPTATPEPPKSPKTGEGSLARGLIKQRPYVVMIDNHPDAYPQSGLGEAALVFEAIAEGGVPRFMAIYYDGITRDLAEIGPVRSTRIYFAHWAMNFQPAYLHAGGSPDGLAFVQTDTHIMNLDFDDVAFRQYGWRDSRRFAPYNLYSSTELIRAWVRDHDFKAVTKSDPEIGYLYDTVAPAAPPEATSISYVFESELFRIVWVYDAATQRYFRTMYNQPHVDRVTDEHLSTRNVVVMEVQEIPRPGDDKFRIDQQVVGSGRALVFQAGRRIEATWRKDSPEAPLRFYDAAGKEVVFNLGHVWIAAIPSFNSLVVQ